MQLKGLSASSDQAQAKAAEWKSRSLFTHRISGCCETPKEGTGPVLRGWWLQQAMDRDKGKTDIHNVARYKKNCVHLICHTLSYIQFQNTSSHIPQELCQRGEERLCASS